MSGPTATTAPIGRDLHIRSINEHGRMHWQKTSGYNRRSKSKRRLIGDILLSREYARRQYEAKMSVKVLNRMLELGGSHYDLKHAALFDFFRCR